MLIGNLPGMVYRCKNVKNWEMEFVSDGCYPLTGYYPSDLVCNASISYAELIHQDDRQMVWDRIQEALVEKQKFQVNYRIITADKKEKWVWEQGQGIFENDNILALEGLILDITPRIKNENQLKEKNEFIETVLSNLPIGLAVNSIDSGNVTYINKKFEEIYG